jgi:hypothetical protein
LGFCALPLTPAWEGVALFSALPWGYRIAFFVTLALFFLGYLKHARPTEMSADGFERWMWLVYPVGLLILPTTHLGLSYLQEGQDQNTISFGTPGWWYGIIPFAICATLLFLKHRGILAFPPRLIELVEKSNLDFVPHFFWRVYRLLGRLITLFSKLLEGEGGVLWALLILMLLVISLSFINAGDSFEF